MKWAFAFAVLRAVDVSVLVRSKSPGVIHDESTMEHLTFIPKDIFIGLVLLLHAMSPGCI